MLEGVPPWIMNGPCLRHEQQTEVLPWVRLSIEDVADAVPQVLGFCHGVHHQYDGLVH